jgi:hypothetical protein
MATSRSFKSMLNEKHLARSPMAEKKQKSLFTPKDKDEPKPKKRAYS